MASGSTPSSTANLQALSNALSLVTTAIQQAVSDSSNGTTVAVPEGSEASNTK